MSTGSAPTAEKLGPVFPNHGIFLPSLFIPSVTLGGNPSELPKDPLIGSLTPGGKPVFLGNRGAYSPLAPASRKRPGSAVSTGSTWRPFPDSLEPCPFRFVTS